MIEWSMRRRVVLAWMAVAAAVAIPAAAQEPPDTVPPNAKRTVLDLKYVVENVGGRVQDLQVRETDLEVRIELAADVLFDFDKAEIRPAAEKTLQQAAGIIRERATGTVRIEGHTDAKGTDTSISGCPSSGRRRSGPGWRAGGSCLA